MLFPDKVNTQRRLYTSRKNDRWQNEDRSSPHSLYADSETGHHQRSFQSWNDLAALTADRKQWKEQCATQMQRKNIDGWTELYATFSEDIHHSSILPGLC